MAVSKKEVQEVAKLAKLHFSEEELDKFTEEFNEILKYFDKLNEINTDDVIPTTHVLDLKNVLRDDVHKKSFDRKTLISQAPDHDGEFFKVPKVIN